MPNVQRKRILITGAAGFIAGYVIDELLRHDWEVVGIDDFSKYGEQPLPHVGHERYRFHRGDCKDAALLGELLEGCDHLLAGAAIIGGIDYLQQRAYDLLAENERITAATFDAAIEAHRNGSLQKITVLSSSMVFSSSAKSPLSEGDQQHCPPPHSTYGFQKLCCEYFARGAQEQYGLPYTIVRPFNCIGTGDFQARDGRTIDCGNVRLAMSHVVPDLIRKILAGQDPLHLLGDGRQVRHFTYGADLARGIRLAIESPRAVNEDFNISSGTSTTIIELAEMIWKKLRPNVPFRYTSDHPAKYDVQNRVPDVAKAKQLLGFETTSDLSQVLDEIIEWVRDNVRKGVIGGAELKSDEQTAAARSSVT